MTKYLDIRHVYLLREKWGKDRQLVDSSVMVPFARRFEGALHTLFASSRFTYKKKKRRWNWQSRCKIGIAKDVKSRRNTIQRNRASGKTEWFYLNMIERCGALLIMFAYFVISWAMLLATVMGSIVLGIEMAKG